MKLFGLIRGHVTDPAILRLDCRLCALALGDRAETRIAAAQHLSTPVGSCCRALLQHSHQERNFCQGSFAMPKALDRRKRKSQTRLNVWRNS
eukprot:6204829-Pleurochrysis_carterae.AAC.1